MHTVRGPSGALRAILPMSRRSGALASPTDWHTPMFGGLAIDREAGAELARSVLSEGHRRVSLSFVRRGDPFIEELINLAAESGRRFVVRPKVRSPMVDLQGGWDGYLKERRSKFRSELRRRRRRLEDEGEVRCDVVADDPSVLDEVLRIEAAGWKGEHGSAMDSTPATKAFYRKASEWAAGKGWLRCAFLRCGQETIACDLAIEASGRHFLVKTGFDPTWSAFGPGMLLRESMIRRAFEDPDLRTYEFLGGDATWKREWAEDSDELSVIHIFGGGAAGRLEYAAQVYGRPVAKRLLHSPSTAEAQA